MKRGRFFFWARWITIAGHVVPSLGVAHLVPWPLAVGLVGSVGAVTVRRFIRMHGDVRRPLWVSRLVDEPLSAHWAASLFTLPLVVPCSLLVWLLVALRELSPAWWSLSGCAFATYATASTIAAWGTWVRRRWVVIRRLELPLSGLAREFDGYRVAQLSDLHLGNFDRKDTVSRWVARTNALEPELVVITGDLVTSGTEFYPDVAEALSGLRARDGVYCVLGNHDQWDEARCREFLEARGVSVLCNQWRELRRGGASLVLAGLDDPYSGKANLDATLRERPRGVPTILLSHYPEWFRAAAAQGVALVLSGHTHGGQLGVPLVADRLNLATLTRQRQRGLFREAGSLLYVNAGLGTTGPPIRVGVPPEIALFTLRAA